MSSSVCSCRLTISQKVRYWSTRNIQPPLLFYDADFSRVALRASLPSLPMSQFVATQIARKPSLYLSVVVPVDTGSKNKENFNFREVVTKVNMAGCLISLEN